jgi:hypothetical protein
MTRPVAIRTLLVILVTASASVVALATSAGAHNDTATMGIEVTPGPEPLTAKVRVLLEYTSDGDVAPGALVVAEATGPDGAAVAATPLADVGGGNYEAVMAMPSEGSWLVTVTATNPAAAASADIGLEAATVTVVPDAPTSPDPEVDISADAVRRTEAPSSDDGPSPALVALIAVAVVAALGAAVVVVRRRRGVTPPGS